jgi:dTDP-4-amino-4,6-dideoxygalactose transaminase
MLKHKRITVTKPVLPPLTEFIPYLEKIWESKILTNNGQLHKQLETELCNYLGVKFISLFCNGTIALITALKALNINGEVITTPYSFVATTHALRWNNIEPVFTDIEPDFYTIDPEKIEAAITSKTTAILPVHVYGNPCKIERIRKIADAYGLKVIYDACHTFGVKIDNCPILSFGDLSVMSFHATKLFTTFEGGAIICHDDAMKKRVDQLKNFGFAGETSVTMTGINGKMNEIQAAMGLLQLKGIDASIDKNKQISERYRERLRGIIGLRYLDDLPGVKHCYSYFPVFIEQDNFGTTRDAVYEELKRNNIFGRRYFFPLISQFPSYNQLESAQPGKMPVAERTTQEVICLPIYPDLNNKDVDEICSILLKTCKSVVNGNKN